MSVKPGAGVTVTGKLAVPPRNRGSGMGAVEDNENAPAVTVKLTALEAVPETPRTVQVAGPVAVEVAAIATGKLVWPGVRLAGPLAVMSGRLHEWVNSMGALNPF